MCKIEGCEKKVYGYGLCSAHYSRWYRYGDPLKGSTPRGSSIGSPARFIKEVIPNHNSDDCLIWPFNKTDKGYGVARGGESLVHRRVCIVRHGQPPSQEHEAAHSCGNSSCVNPRHVRWATRVENMADAILHDTLEYGERRYNAKLTNAQVIEIKSLKGVMRNKDVCEAYGIKSSRLSAIWNGRSWRRVSA